MQIKTIFKYKSLIFKILKFFYDLKGMGVFIRKGVGCGCKASSGFVIRAAKGPQSNPRFPQQWFNPVSDKYIPELANEIARVNADVAINATRMKIN